MTPDRTPAERRAADIIQGWLDGAAPDAAAALAANPELATEKAIVLDLAFAEFLIREHKGEKLDPEAFCGRFPDYHASLGRMLAQQSVGERSPALDAALPDTLAARTVQARVEPIPGSDHGTDPGPRPPAAPTDGPPGGGSPNSGSTAGGQRSGGWPEPGGKVGDFNLLRQLGKGAFGRVFLAMEETTTRHVVVKVSKQKCDEAKVLGRLGHRNVVSVLSAPHDFPTGLFLVVMPYHGSATLEDLLEVAYPLRKDGPGRPTRADTIVTAARRNLRSDDPVPDDLKPDPFLTRAGFTDGVVWLGVRMAEALSAVHACGFVHHDLKPSNVLLGLDGHPRVLDFNLASDVRNAKSRLGGTLPYMPPEHLQAVTEPGSPGHDMDVRGDVYSLGVILYELLAGAHPFGRFPRSRSVRAVAAEMLSRQKEGVRPLRDRVPELPTRLTRLVEKCLAFDPAARPQTATEVAQELKRCYSARKRAAQFLASRPGRLAVTTAAVGLFSSATWMASANARPALPTEDYRKTGLTAVADGRYANAVPALLKAADANPDDPDVWLNLGRARVAQRDWLAARPDLERAATLRADHGPSQATLAWCLAKVGLHAEALAALSRAEAAGYTPAGLYALRGYCHLGLRQDAPAAAALERCLELNPGHRAGHVNRAQLALVLAQGLVKPAPASAVADVEKALTAGPADGYLCLSAARFYAWQAFKPPHIKGAWSGDVAGAKDRCRGLLRQAVELGLPDGMWKTDSTFGYLLGDPAVYAKDWVRGATEADPSAYWRMCNPLVEFGG